MNEHNWTLRHLTWYINGTLVGEEHARAHRHISECLICQKELQCQQHIASAVGSPANVTSNAALALSEIDSHLNAKQSVVKQGWQRVLAIVARTPRAMRIVAAGQAVILIGALSLLLTNDAPDQGALGDATGSYQVLSSAEAPKGDIRIVFSPITTVAEQHQLLQSIDANIVSGPTRRGVLTLELSNTFSKDDTSRIPVTKDLLLQLRSNPSVVFIEPLGNLLEPQ